MKLPGIFERIPHNIPVGDRKARNVAFPVQPFFEMRTEHEAARTLKSSVIHSTAICGNQASYLRQR
jgi:hypothetical protein